MITRVASQHAFALVVAGALMLASTTFAQDETKKREAEAVFKQATDLMDKKEYGPAIPYLQQLQTEYPDNHAVLWNLGIAFVETNENAKAAETWKRLQQVAPDDWRAISKLVQAYQALGDIKARDNEIKKLYEFRKNSPDPKVKGLERFCREQFTISGQKGFAFEYFFPLGPWKKYFVFSALDENGQEKFSISLGSYDLTTENVARTW